MTLDFRGRNLALTPALQARMLRSFSLALSRFEDRIGSVRVRVDDVNGPRGGVDKRCTVHVRGRGEWAVRVEQSGADLYAAIDAAADRAGHAVARAVERARELH